MNHLSIKPSHQLLRLRKLLPEDLPFCSKLIKQAGWNQIDADWNRVMGLDPEGCFIVEYKGEKAGTIVFTRFGKVDPEDKFRGLSWISMVLVDKSFRGKGIGQWMFGEVLSLLKDEGVQTIRLDATDMGVNLYKKYGFREEYTLIRMVRDKVEANKSDEEENQLSQKEISKVVELDRLITGTDRQRLIEYLAMEISANLFVDISDGGEVNGYAGIRSGRTGRQIGPCIAKETESGLALLERALSFITGEKAIIDIPANNNALLEWAKYHNFKEQRPFIRMYAGRRIEDHPDKIFASFGPEKG